ncbi:MAG: polysaccharide deacetylase family protein [Gammaproteobacteria bacterium]
MAVLLSEALQRLAAGTLPPCAVSITFDDGYANNLHHALPVLESLSVPATVFVATGYLDGGCMFNDGVIEVIRGCGQAQLDLSSLGLGTCSLASDEERRSAIASLLGELKYRPLAERTELVARMADLAGVQVPRDLMLTSAEVKVLHQRGIEIGGHTVHHPILTRLAPDEAQREIADGAARLEAITGTRPRLFAYPNGQPGRDFGPEHAAMVRDAGFSHALTTQAGLGRQGTDPYQIPRITLWSRTAPRLAVNLMRLYARSG